MGEMADMYTDMWSENDAFDIGPSEFEERMYSIAEHPERYSIEELAFFKRNQDKLDIDGKAKRMVDRQYTRLLGFEFGNQRHRRN